MTAEPPQPDEIAEPAPPGPASSGRRVVGGVLTRRDEVKDDGRRISFYDQITA